MTTILLDGDVWLHRACSVAATRIDWGDSEVSWSVNVKRAAAMFRSQVARFEKRLDADDTIVALGDRNANFRKELSPTYKAHRNRTMKPPGFLELEAMVERNARVVREPRLEGDDILGILATQPDNGHRVVVTVDKDLQSVPCTLYNPDTDTLQGWGEEEADLHHLYQTLTGDKCDGYPGCPGVGPVRASKILAGDAVTQWERVVEAFEKAGQTEEQALLQARLAFVLRRGYYDRKTKEVKLWTPTEE